MEKSAVAPKPKSRASKRLRGWFTRQADSFVSEAVKEAGKELGKWGMRVFLILLAAIFVKLFAV
jgi:hypothetical protein